jgi:hypothetical protein
MDDGSRLDDANQGARTRPAVIGRGSEEPVLALSAGVIVSEAELSVGEASVLIVVFTVIATSTVAVPVVAHLVAPARMHGPFQRLREWLVENNVTIMGLLLFLIGVVMIGNGIASL